MFKINKNCIEILKILINMSYLCRVDTKTTRLIKRFTRVIYGLNRLTRK